MQNISFRVPAVRTHYTVSSTGVVTYMNEQSSSRFILRSQSGYTGARPKTKPMPIHAYSLNCQDITAVQEIGDYFYSNGSKEFGTGPTLSTTVAGATYYPAVGFSDVYNDALEKLTSKVRGDLDISIDLAEAHKTLKMFNAVEKVIDYTRTFRRRFGVLKVASNLWLEYTYGVRPLLGTVYGAADENLRTVINRSQRYSARASRTIKMERVVVNTIWGPVSYPIVGGYFKYSTTLGLDLRTDQFDIGRWSSLNPVSIAWELTPFSFVVDWFLNVGGYLRNMETYLLYANKFRSGYRTNLSVSEHQGLIVDRLNSPTEVHFSQHRCTVKHTDIQRTILSSYPAPSLPSLKADLGSSRLTSAAALLSQLLGRR